MTNWQAFKSLLPYPLRIGTRDSKLALKQTDMVLHGLQNAYPELKKENAIQIVPIKTTGDKVLDCHLADIGGKALFAKEIETALLENDIDIAVHSLKDIPGFLPDGLVIERVLPREEPFDVFISDKYNNFDDLPEGAVVGTSSPRRTAQIKHMRPDINIELIRGNVETRVKKVKEGQYDATFLALAGLRRLNKEDIIKQVMPIDKMLPAVGQGVIAIEHREEDDYLKEFLAPLHCPITYTCIQAEREVMKTIDGNCHTPLAAYARIMGDKLTIEAELFSEDGSNRQQAELTASASEAELIGKKVGDILLGHDK